MKIKITSVLLLAVLMATATFASTGKSVISRDITTTFNQRFSDAKDVRWQTTSKYVKASFKLDEQAMFAYFTPAGELIGVGRNMTSSQLPIHLQNQLKKNYSDGWITELSEFATEDETTYFATIEDGQSKILLKSIGSISWERTKKVKKIGQ